MGHRRAPAFLVGVVAGLLGCSSRSRSPDARPACTAAGCVETLYDRGDQRYPQRGLVVDRTSVYWQELAVEGSTRTSVVRAGPKDGRGPTRDLGPWGDYGSSAALVVDDTHVYWLYDGKLMRASKDGAAPSELAIPGVETLDPGPLQDAGDAIVVGSHGCRAMTRVPKDGSAPQTWPIIKPRAAGGVTGIEIDGPIYYCSNGQAVHALDTGNGQVQQIAVYAGQTGSIRKVGGDLYWTETSNPDTKTWSLVRLSAGSDRPVAVGPMYGEAGALLFDSSRGKLYWTTGLATRDCDAVSYDVKSQETSFLARNLNVFGDCGQDDGFVYWIAMHAIMRVRK
jgi:hypothetical protein